MHNEKKIHTAIVCRVCADPKPTNFLTMNEHNGWFDLFQDCFGLLLSSKDHPLTLCEQCAYKIKDFTSFKAQGIKTDSLWRLADIEHNKNNIPESSVNETLEEDEEIIKEETDMFNEPESSVDSDFYWNEAECKSETKLENLCDNEKNENEISFNIDDVKLEDKVISRSGKIFEIRKDSIKISKCPISPATNYNKDYGDTLLKPRTQLSNELTRNQEDGTDFCGLCNFSTEDNDVMKKHLDVHWVNSKLQCLLCEFVGKDQAAILAHRHIHCKIKARLQCHLCHKKINKTLRGMEFHYRSVHLHKLGGLCSHRDCDKTFRNWRTWKKHELRHLHPGYTCDLCGQKYKNRKCIVEHVRYHMKSPDPSICNYCGRVFVRQRNMDTHIKNVHTPSKSVKCSHCSRIYKNQSRLDFHLKQIAKEKKWKCQLCSSAFVRLSEFKRHVQFHSDERPFSCEVCRASFKSKGQLVIHVRKHTGERPFKCLHCANAFTSSNQLKTHTIVHTGIKPYKCAHCNRMFREKRMMVKHSALCQVFD